MSTETTRTGEIPAQRTTVQEDTARVIAGNTALELAELDRREEHARVALWTKVRLLTRREFTVTYTASGLPVLTGTETSLDGGAACLASVAELLSEYTTEHDRRQARRRAITPLPSSDPADWEALPFNVVTP